MRRSGSQHGIGDDEGERASVRECTPTYTTSSTASRRRYAPQTRRSAEQCSYHTMPCHHYAMPRTPLHPHHTRPHSMLAVARMPACQAVRYSKSAYMYIPPIGLPPTYRRQPASHRSPWPFARTHAHARPWRLVQVNEPCGAFPSFDPWPLQRMRLIIYFWTS